MTQVAVPLAPVDANDDPDVAVDDDHDDEAQPIDEAAGASDAVTGDGDDDDDESDQTRASATPIALPSLDPAAPTTVFRGLAAVIPGKGALLLAIAKLADGQLRVTVQPPPAPDEPAETVVPLVVTAAPEDLDREFVAAFAAYQPARAYATASAAEVARQTKVAADKARSDAEARRKKTITTSTPSRKPTGTLIVTTTPTAATIKVAAGDGKTLDARSGKPLTIVPGKATITATHAEHKSKLATVTIAAGKTEHLTLELPASEPSLFT